MFLNIIKQGKNIFIYIYIYIYIYAEVKSNYEIIKIERKTI